MWMVPENSEKTQLRQDPRQELFWESARWGVAAVSRVLCGQKEMTLEECPRPPAVFYANHTSNLDSVVIWSAMPTEYRRRTRPAAAHDYWSATEIRRRLALNVFRAILIERRQVTRANNPMTKLGEALSSGDSIIIFPEGTRSLDFEIGEFKPGIYQT